MLRFSLSRRRWLAQAAASGWVLVATAQGPAWATPAPAARGDQGADPAHANGAKAAGSFEALEFDWNDRVRQRVVPVRLYWPHPLSPDQQIPLLVFSHGIGGSRRGYAYLGTHWARQGWASLHLQHVGSDRALWQGGMWSVVSRLQAAAQGAEAVARVQDLRFALDQILSGNFGQRIDTSRVVVAGHSYGANTALLASGARVFREGGVLELADPRIKAAIVISAPPFYGEGDPGSILATVQVPTLHVTATDDVIRIPGYYSGLQDRLSVYEAIGNSQKWLAVFAGGSHSMFTDRMGTGGVVLNPKVKTATQELSMAFLRGVLDGDGQALRDWPHQFAPLLARFNAGT
ncbi:MAG: acetylhydrolase [Betaproteobacteria bacterium]|nr:acetylhydrolase [Betaproteobacteria bacterium]